MTHDRYLDNAVSFCQQFLGEFLLTAASLSALPFIDVFASTGMIMWAAVGLVGLILGMAAVRISRRHNQPAEHALDKTPLNTAARPANLANTGPVSPGDVTQAA